MFDENIPDNSLYIERMEKSLLDKSLFMSHIDADIIVDFGCANGALIKFLSKLFPEKHFIGYDISHQMIERATLNLKNYNNVYLYFIWEDVVKRINTLKHTNPKYKTCLVCSSVIHEVYAYAKSYKDIELFWKIFWNSEFDYLVVRDMYRDPSNSYSPFYSNYYLHEKFLASPYSKEYSDFVLKWGEPKTINDFHHFFLKYFYQENWKRELNENYLPKCCYINHMIHMEGSYSGYESFFEIKYILPYIKERVKKDFGVKIYHPTHYQKIFKKIDDHR